MQIIATKVEVREKVIAHDELRELLELPESDQLIGIEVRDEIGIDNRPYLVCKVAHRLPIERREVPSIEWSEWRGG